MLPRRQLVQALAASWALPALAATPRFGVQGQHFMLDGQPLQIRAGELHYPRIPRDCWRDRLRKLKALGLNTVSAYTFWGAHEREPGQISFSGNLDVAAFVRLCQQEGLHVLLRPGPYVCAEWDGGGLPAWLTASGDVPVRSTDPRYLQPVRQWLRRLGQELAPLLIDCGGPILMTQVENEYGAYGKDAAYLQALREAVREAGFDGVLYTADPSRHLLEGSLPGIPAAINFGANEKAETEFARRDELRPDGPAMCGELWCGWFDAYGVPHETTAPTALAASLAFMQSRGYSFSLYMVHGGTSFGFAPGANWDAKGYQPMVTSYDYDAPLDEAGRPGPKAETVREVLGRHLPASAFAPWPEPERALSIARFALTESTPLASALGPERSVDAPRGLDAQGQWQGLMRYRYRGGRRLRGRLDLGEVRDFALVRSRDQLLGRVDRRLEAQPLALDLRSSSTLDIWLDTTGHVHYGKHLGRDQKGLLGPVLLGGEPLIGWQQAGAPLLGPNGGARGFALHRKPLPGPAFYRGQFTLGQTGYTFLDLRGWGRGYVWVNGQLLGRHWHIGPQHTLYVPAEWLRTGLNELVVLDLLDARGPRTVAGGPEPVWDRKT